MPHRTQKTDGEERDAEERQYHERHDLEVGVRRRQGSTEGEADGKHDGRIDRLTQRRIGQRSNCLPCQVAS